LLRTAKGENHKVAVRYLSLCPQIPASMDEIGLAEGADRRQIFVSLEANEMNAAPHLFLRTSPRYIGPMAKTLYRVSIRQVDKEGRITWHGVLTTDDHEKANETLDMLKGDPEVRVKLEAIVPGRGYEEIIQPNRGDL
jgi:hypothetical protein